MARTRVLVVEDSATVRERLCSVLASDPEIEVVGEAEDGRQAIELCRALRPDVVTMDMMLPVMSGLAATEYIMAHCPTPILVVSSSTNRGELFKTYDALAAGAVDVLEKPRGDEPEGDWERRFLATLKLVARIRVITHLRARLDGRRSTGPSPPERDASGGAGRAVRQIRVAANRRLDRRARRRSSRCCARSAARFSPPVLLVLHLNEPFGSPSPTGSTRRPSGAWRSRATASW